MRVSKHKQSPVSLLVMAAAAKVAYILAVAALHGLIFTGKVGDVDPKGTYLATINTALARSF